MSKTPANFNVLIAAARAGDRQALGELLEAYRPLLLSEARALLGRSLQSKAEAGELVQETFLQATKSIATFHGKTVRQWIDWLKGILTHKCQKLIAQFCRTDKRDVGRETPFDGSITDWLAVRDDRNRARASRERDREFIIQVFKPLEAGHRRILVLHHLKGKSFAEIARATGRSVEAVRKQHVRALVRCRQQAELLAAALGLTRSLPKGKAEEQP